MNCLVVSYIPLLTGEPGDTIGASPEGLAQLVKFADSLPDGQADAILWGISPEGDPWPIFVLPDADKLFDHLVDWCEGSPTSWFDLRLVTRGDDYAMALVPRVQMSVERFRLAWELKHGSPPPEASSFRVLFKSIHFASQPGTVTTFRQVRPLLKSPVKVGFLDSKRFSDVADIPENLDPSLVWWAGPFDIQGDQDGLVTSMLAPSKNKRKAERRARRK
jgi:hypothetical protein